MLDFLIPKTKVQYFDIQEINIESFEILGIGQINPYCKSKTDKETFVTLVTIANDSKEYDEKEGMILTDFFTIRRCPKCKKIKLIPTKIRINQSSTYIKNEEEVAFGSFHNSRYNFPTKVEAFCNSCSSCFEILIKNRDTWIKEAKKIKERDIIGACWDEYQID